MTFFEFLNLEIADINYCRHINFWSVLQVCEWKDSCYCMFTLLGIPVICIVCGIWNHTSLWTDSFFQLYRMLYVGHFTNMEFPAAFMGFDSNASYIDVCEYCSAFDFDTLELFLNGCNFLCFYSINDFEACCFYCNLRSFHVKKYVLLQVWILFIEKVSFAIKI